MQNHTKVYLDFFGYTEGDFIPCELMCGSVADDIHHIECRGMGGSKTKDVIENLMGLCRKDHILFGDKKQWTEYLKMKHTNFMKHHNDKHK